ncbi:MAG: DNA cytosine methyltransferase [Kiritimatiellae bacterium]|nr:DNA cytosine methyltransferase [Kiritimatiellia bacterium]
MRVISLFSGAGGLDIGFHDAGFETAVMVERDPACCRTLRTNMPDTPVIEGDINEITTDMILETGHLKPLEAALVIGGPPCQSFSLAGKRMGLDDPRGRLVLEFIRVVREALPVGFVMENVRGLANWEHGRALEAILEEATQPVNYREHTYRYEVKYQVLNSAAYGAPQFRERIFIVGNRVHVPFEFPVPTHGDVKSTTKVDLFGHKVQPYMTVWDAIGNLPPATPPSETALRVAGTIKERIEKHGY